MKKPASRISLKAFLDVALCRSALLAQNDSTQATAVLKMLPANDGENRFQAGLILGRAEAYAPPPSSLRSARASDTAILT